MARRLALPCCTRATMPSTMATGMPTQVKAKTMARMPQTLAALAPGAGTREDVGKASDMGISNG
ncbi:MAG TPA: hypothetical protein DHV93_08585 [Holophagaceae bacterium]|nr:hypothetical protein [Holophagaceae bacterium]